MIQVSGAGGESIQEKVLLAPWLTESAGDSEQAVLARENSLKQLHIYIIPSFVIL